MLLPMSCRKPYVLAAVFALACRSCLTQRIHSIEGTDTQTLISRAYITSIRGLKEALSDGPVEAEAMCAASLLLCLGEIYAGGHCTTAWRVHLEGAKRLFDVQASSSQHSRATKLSPSILEQMFTAVAVQAVLHAEPVSHQWVHSSSAYMEDDFLDEFVGFSTALNPILTAIGQIARLPLHRRIFEGECLLRKLDLLAARHHSRQPEFRSGIQGASSEGNHRQFLLTNVAYQHAARIQIHRRLLGKVFLAAEVQSGVQGILDCMRHLGQGQGQGQEQDHSPWITMVMPTFTAGCEAQAYSDHMEAAMHLRMLETSIGARNILHVRQIMEESWAKRNLNGEFLDLDSWNRSTCKSRLIWIRHGADADRCSRLYHILNHVREMAAYISANALVTSNLYIEIAKMQHTTLFAPPVSTG